MSLISIEYVGDLKTRAYHSLSGESIKTDAPPDNNGKGEFFSPSDIFVTSLGSCMLTIMGIAANTNSIYRCISQSLAHAQHGSSARDSLQTAHPRHCLQVRP